MSENELRGPAQYEARIILNPLNGVTTFEFRGERHSQVALVDRFGRPATATIPMEWHEDHWVARLFLLPGRYKIAFAARGEVCLEGVAEVKLDYRDLAPAVLW